MALQGCVYAAALPPSRVDLAKPAVLTEGGFRSGRRVLLGVHSASASASNDAASDYDVGVGYVFERLESPPRNIARTWIGDESNPPASHGAYLELSRIVQQAPEARHRTWLGLRAEYLEGEDNTGGGAVAGTARAAWEIHRSVDGSGGGADPCGAAAGAVYGNLGIGVFGEAGLRSSLDGDVAFSVAVGISLRIPAFFVMGAALCH